MARFYVEETWRDVGVDVEMFRDEAGGRVQLGAFVVGYPEGGFPKKVREAALKWLIEHAGMKQGDSLEIQLATEDVRGLLERLEAAVSA